MINLKDKKIAVVSLGCDKNRVDTEKMLANISEFATVTQTPEQANVIIINTCAFLEASRAEAIDTILEFSQLKDGFALEKVVVTGCLPQICAEELFSELTEADVLLGCRDYSKLKEALEESYTTGNRVNYVGKGDKLCTSDRIVTTPLHYAYLKIADGCSNHCTYCLIPSIRGKYVSEKMEDLLKEAEELGDVNELILVAQDITRYGTDLYGTPRLTELIKKLSLLKNIGSIRLLYCYPDMISEELIAEIKTNPKVIKYIDIPLQHADNGVLKLMNRKGTGEEYLKLIDRLKAEIPGIAIRSTFITGFPGEDQAAFDNLKDFIKKARLFNAGFFAYSREEGTPSYKLKNQVDEDVKQQRLIELYSLQEKISAENLNKFVGQTLDVVFDEIDYDKQAFCGRAYFNAPDIDGKVYFTSDVTVNQGEVYKIKITNADSYDLYGSVEDEFTE